MVKGGEWEPGGCRVTIPTIRPEAAAMRVIFLMAGITGCRCAFVNPVDVATVACDAGVRTGQHKSGRIMVKGGRDPAGCCVTGAAIRAELTAVRIIFLMAG